MSTSGDSFRGRRGNYLTIGKLGILVTTIFILLLPRISNAIYFNIVSLELRSLLLSESSWTQQVVNQPNTYNTILQSKNHISLLKKLQVERKRDTLAQIFGALQFALTNNDEKAVTVLLELKAYGLLLNLGEVFNGANQRNRAALYLQAALTLNPTDYPIIRQLSIFYLEEQRYCDLMHIAQTGINNYDSPLFYYYLGRAYEGMESWTLAAMAYKEALERFPDYEPYEKRLRHVTRAIESEEETITIAPTCSR